MNNGSNRGFTLAELAIAIAIIGLLLASALLPLSTQVELRAISDTQRTIEEIKEALIGYTLANGRLPCPASGAVATGGTNAGVEQYDGTNCTVAYGVVPWSTLGVPERDAWGRRFSYRVAPAFADAIGSTWATSTTTTPASPANQSTSVTCNPPTDPLLPAPVLSSIALCTLGDIAVFSPTESTRQNPPTDAVAKGVAAVIISHGRNGFGAWLSSGQQFTSPTTTHELANVNGTNSASPTTATPTGGFTSHPFFSRPPTAAQSGTCSDIANGSPFCEFDDVLAWISPSTLVARMVSAGRLP